jgi:hypothetical protein
MRIYIVPHCRIRQGGLPPPPPRTCMSPGVTLWDTLYTICIYYTVKSIYYKSHQYRNKSKTQLTSPTPAQLPADAVSTGHIVSIYCKAAEWDIYIYCKEVINCHQSIVGIAAELSARNLTSRVQIPADPKFQFFLSFLRATLKIWLQIAKPFKKMAKPF